MIRYFYIYLLIILLPSCTTIQEKFTKDMISYTSKFIIDEDTVFILKTTNMFDAFLNNIKKENKDLNYIDYYCNSKYLEDCIIEVKKLP